MFTGIVEEVGRIARPGGRIFLTAFVEEKVPEASINPANYGPYPGKCPMEVVRYNKDYLFSLFERNGLIVDEFRYHGAAFPYQSEIYLSKSDSHA